MFSELGHGGSRDRKRDRGVQKWQERVEILSSVAYPTFLSLVIELGYLGDLTS